MADVSVGTVDRVIHNRGRVSESKKAKIEQVMAEMGYAPGVTARTRTSKKKKVYRIAVIAPAHEHEAYWGMVSDGIGRAAEELRQHCNLSVDFIHFDECDRESFPAPSAILDGGYSGVIMAALFEERAAELSVALGKAEIPYIYVDSSIEGQDDIAYFGVDSFRSGFIAGKMLVREAGPSADIVICHIRCKRDTLSVRLSVREEGLIKYLAGSGHSGRVFYQETDLADPEAGVAALEEYLSKVGGAVGVIVLNSRIHELASFIGALRPEFKKRVIMAGFEAISPNVEALMAGDVCFLISQRPELQGYNAAKALGNYFLSGERPDRVNLMPIDILLPENIEYYDTCKKP